MFAFCCIIEANIQLVLEIWRASKFNLHLIYKGFIFEINRPQDLMRSQSMQKQRIEYASPVDAIIAVTKRLSVYETRYQMSTEDFFDKFTKGAMDDCIDFVEWANDYRHFMTIKLELEKLRRHAA
jgi:hypothetical protein